MWDGEAASRLPRCQQRSEFTSPLSYHLAPCGYCLAIPGLLQLFYSLPTAQPFKWAKMYR